MKKINDYRADLASEFLVQAKMLNEGRWARFARAPLRLILIKILRTFGVVREVKLSLNFAGKYFFGVLPEAVSSMIWRFNHFDPKTSYLVARFLPKNGVFLDVGAHFGYFSMLASECVGEDGRVISFEAMPSTFGFLKRNIEKNGFADICSVFNVAAYNDEVELEFVDFGVVNSSLNSAFGNRNTKVNVKSRARIKVPAGKLDHITKEIGLDRVDLIKIDAESSEYFVIEGLVEVLQKFSPRVIVELGDQGVTGTQKTAKDIIGLMSSMNYDCFVCDDFGELSMLPTQESYAYCNVLFAPASSIEE